MMPSKREHLPLACCIYLFILIIHSTPLPLFLVDFIVVLRDVVDSQLNCGVYDRYVVLLLLYFLATF